MKIRISDLMQQSGVKFGTSGARGLADDMTDSVCYAYTKGFLQYLVEDGELKPGAPVAIAGDLRPDSPNDMRGFVGIAFRVQPNGSQFECFYLRPTNGRAEDQLRRNHATQYISHPDHSWHKLRQENPGVYESYTDLVPGEWTRIKIEVAGTHAKLYVGKTQS